MPRPIHVPSSAPAVPRLTFTTTSVRGIADQATQLARGDDAHSVDASIGPSFGYNNPVTMCFDVEPSLGWARSFSCVEMLD
jgi:hypothetical protein